MIKDDYAGLFKGLYKHHTDESVVSRSIICHPPEPACAGKSMVTFSPLEPSSHDQLVLEVQIHSSEVSRVPALQEVYSVLFIGLQLPFRGLQGCSMTFRHGPHRPLQLLMLHCSWKVALPYNAYRAVFGPLCFLPLSRGEKLEGVSSCPWSFSFFLLFQSFNDNGYFISGQKLSPYQLSADRTLNVYNIYVRERTPFR